MKTISNTNKVVLSGNDVLRYFNQRGIEFARRSGDEWSFRCPFHNDRTPSASLNVRTGLWKCFGCDKQGSVFDFEMLHSGTDFRTAASRVRKTLGLGGDNALSSRPVRSREYFYRDENGKALFKVIRKDFADGTKKFTQCHRDSNGAWIWNIQGVRRVLYRLPEVLAAKTVLIVEGEKCVNVLRQLNLQTHGHKIAVTTNSGGAGKWRNEYNQFLQDKSVYIFPDHDEPGKSHAQSVAQSIVGVAKCVRIVELPGLTEKEDVADFIQRHPGGAAKRILKMMRRTPQWRNEMKQVSSHNSHISPSFLGDGDTTVTEPIRPPEAAFHGLAGEIVRMFEPHTEADPAAILVQLLTAFGSVIGRKPHFRVESDRHRGNLFVVLVGETARSRRGVSWKNAKRMFRIADPIWFKEKIVNGLSSGEGIIHKVRDPSTQRQNRKPVVDPGVKDKRLLVVEGEFASVLKRMSGQGNTLSAVLRQAWDGDNLQTITKQCPQKATTPHISVIGHITQRELLRYLNDVEMANGFGNRFIWVWVKRSKFLPEGGSPRPEEINPLMNRLSEAIRFSKQVRELKRSPLATKIWRRVYEKLSSGESGTVGSILARGEAQVVRLANLYALLDQSVIVKAKHMKAALALWDYSERSARFIFTGVMGDPTEERILNGLRSSSKGLTRTEITGLLGGHMKSNVIRAALTTLEQQGLAHRKSVKTNGRTAEQWYLTQKNPVK